jgi:NTP pyrophosphatase (non-canonical NTP hydrolase)
LINELCKAAHENAKEKGFYEPEPSTLERLALIHSEVSEAIEAIRNDNFVEVYSPLEETMDILVNDGEDSHQEFYKKTFDDFCKSTFEDELADICIRVFDLAGACEIDLEFHIKAKMIYNKMRPHKHGKKY